MEIYRLSESSDGGPSPCAQVAALDGYDE